MDNADEDAADINARVAQLQAAGRINREQSAEEVVTKLRGNAEKAPAFGAAAAWNYRR